jgi:hypothetical protein
VSKKLSQILKDLEQKFDWAFRPGHARQDFLDYLAAVHKRVRKWQKSKVAKKRQRSIEKIKQLKMRPGSDIFRTLLAATSKVDAKTQSMWARVLRKATQKDIPADELVYRVKQAGGAAKFLK